MKQEKITASAIARLAHVNQSTVSRALSPEQAWRISPEKRSEILALCSQYGYAPASVSKRSSRLKTMKVGFLLGHMEQDLSSISFSLLLRHLCDFLQASNYTLTLIHVDFSSKELVRNVKRIIRSNIADIYICGSTLLAGQSLELFQKNSRIIHYLPEYSEENRNLNHRWISSIGCEYEEAYSAMLRTIGAPLFASCCFFGFDNKASFRKLTDLNELNARHRFFKGKMETCLLANGCTVPHDQTYRVSRKFAAEYYPVMLDKRLIFCSGALAAQALADEFQTHGRIADRDFFIVTYKDFIAANASNPESHEPFSFIGADISVVANRLCELILDLADTPVPLHAKCPLVFQPSPAFSG